MNLSPSNNLNLLGYSEFFLSLKNLHDKNLLPNKIIFSGANGIGKSTFVYHLINYIFSINEVNKYNFENNRISEDNYSYKLLKNNCHPNLFIITNDDETRYESLTKFELKEITISHE